MIKQLMMFAAAAVVAVAMPAKASNYSVAFDGSTFDVNAAVQTDAFDYVMTIAGTVTGPNGAAITGLTPGSNPSWNYDNQLFATTPYVSNGGILFSAGAWIYNLYEWSGAYYLSTYNPDGTLYNPGDVGTLTVTAVPLPAAAWLFGSALLGLGWARRSRQQAQEVLSA